MTTTRRPRYPGTGPHLMQTTHSGMIQLDGGTASGRAYICELIRLRDGRSELTGSAPPVADSGR